MRPPIPPIDFTTAVEVWSTVGTWFGGIAAFLVLSVATLAGEPPSSQDASGTPLFVIVIGAVAGAMTIATVTATFYRALSRLYSETVGRRRSDYRKLRALACGVRTEYVTELLGEPVFLSNGYSRRDGQHTDWVDRIYLLKECCVQTRCTTTGQVATFSITTMTSKFRPVVFFPRVEELVLGLHTFEAASDDAVSAEAASDEPADLFVSPHTWGYAEQHYMGNPGYYQTYVLGYNNSSDAGNFATEYLSENDRDAVMRGDAIPVSALGEFRKHSIPNTITTVGPHLDWADYSSPRGPERDTLRVLRWP